MIEKLYNEIKQEIINNFPLELSLEDYYEVEDDELDSFEAHYNLFKKLTEKYDIFNFDDERQLVKFKGIDDTEFIPIVEVDENNRYHLKGIHIIDIVDHLYDNVDEYYEIETSDFNDLKIIDDYTGDYFTDEFKEYLEFLDEYIDNEDIKHTIKYYLKHNPIDIIDDYVKGFFDDAESYDILYNEEEDRYYTYEDLENDEIPEYVKNQLYDWATNYLNEDLQEFLNKIKDYWNDYLVYKYLEGDEEDIKNALENVGVDNLLNDRIEVISDGKSLKFFIKDYDIFKDKEIIRSPLIKFLAGYIPIC